MQFMSILLNILILVIAVFLTLWFLPLSLMILISILCIMLYFLPSYIAFKKSHPNKIALLLVKILFGFTFIVWCVCLIFALTYRQSLNNSVK